MPRRLLGAAAATLGVGHAFAADDPAPADAAIEAGEPVPTEDLRWKKNPIDPYYETDFTAYTLDKKAVRLGIFNLDYGLLDNFQIGTSPILDVYGLFTLRGKITAISIPKLDLSMESTIGRYDASKFAAIDNLVIWSYPISVRTSWIVVDRWSLHTGLKWHNIDVVGQFNFDTLGETLAPVIGVKLPPQTKAGLGQAGSIYAGAHLTLGQVELATDFRFNRRDSMILAYHGYLYLGGVIDAGYRTEQGNQIAECGVHQRTDLFGEVPGTTTLSWQWSYERFALRVGIPLSTPKSIAEDYTPLVWIGQGFTLYWIL